MYNWHLETCLGISFRNVQECVEYKGIARTRGCASKGKWVYMPLNGKWARSHWYNNKFQLSITLVSQTLPRGLVVPPQCAMIQCRQSAIYWEWPAWAPHFSAWSSQRGSESLWIRNRLMSVPRMWSAILLYGSEYCLGFFLIGEQWVATFCSFFVISW